MKIIAELNNPTIDLLCASEVQVNLFVNPSQTANIYKIGSRRSKIFSIILYSRIDFQLEVEKQQAEFSTTNGAPTLVNSCCACFPFFSWLKYFSRVREAAKNKILFYFSLSFVLNTWMFVLLYTFWMFVRIISVWTIPFIVALSTVERWRLELPHVRLVQPNRPPVKMDF